MCQKREREEGRSSVIFYDPREVTRVSFQSHPIYWGSHKCHFGSREGNVRWFFLWKKKCQIICSYVFKLPQLEKKYTKEGFRTAAETTLWQLQSHIQGITGKGRSGSHTFKWVKWFQLFILQGRLIFFLQLERERMFHQEKLCSKAEVCKL